jgi:uncharacterized protein (DUF433 family)
MKHARLGSVSSCGTSSGQARRAWVFKRTRVPVKTLFENLEAGATVNGFLEWFPGVGRDQVIAVLDFAGRTLVTT